jgi:hypothetical protein
LHSFNLAKRAWTELSPAPVSPRGGAALVYHDGHLYLHGGFDGNEHSELVVYSVSDDTWKSPSIANANGDQSAVPAPRSVHSMMPIASSNGNQANLVVLFGEGHPSDIGHDGAGNFFEDGWYLSIVKGQEDGALQASWTKLNFAGDIPPPRGWFQAVPLSGDKFLVSGGLKGDNTRLADLYNLHIVN